MRLLTFSSLAVALVGCVSSADPGDELIVVSTGTSPDGKADEINGSTFSIDVVSRANGLTYPNGEHGIGYQFSAYRDSGGTMTIHGPMLSMLIPRNEERELAISPIRIYPTTGPSKLGFLLYSDDGWDDTGVHTPLVECAVGTEKINLFTSLTIDDRNRLLRLPDGRELSFHDCGISDHLFNDQGKLFELFMVPVHGGSEDYAYSLDVQWSAAAP